MGKGEVKKVVLSYLTEEELLSEEELERANVSREDVLELKKLELQERDKSIQLKLRELEIREKELAIEYKAKEIELEKAKSKVATPVDTKAVVDVGKHICFVPSFQEVEVDKYFMHFKKIAASLKLPEDSVITKCINWKGQRDLFSPSC